MFISLHTRRLAAVIETRNRKGKEITTIPEANGRHFTPGLGRNLNEFLQSLGEVLIDITALEVNTMVVERITGDKFIAKRTEIFIQYLSNISNNRGFISLYLSDILSYAKT
jgi:hypothetical protein